MHDEDSMENILSDYDKYVKPHLLHWLHPKYHAYFEGVTNYESVLGEMLTTGTGFMTMTWVAFISLHSELISLNLIISGYESCWY